MIFLEEYKHNNCIDIHNIKLVSQRAPVSLLGSYVFMFSVYGIELLVQVTNFKKRLVHE